MNTYIIGHLKPDTDAVVAAMATAYMYSQLTESGYTNPTAVITQELNPETTFLFSKLSIAAPPVITAGEINRDDQVILVDHNEESQRLTNLNQEQIVAIIDHHKVNVNLPNPIALTIKPWGSTSTIVYFAMKQYSVLPEKNLATLMLAAILSDTVGYKSATTTESDKVAGEALAQLAGITDVEAFTLEIFKAKSDVSKLSDQEIVKNDYKVFEFGKKTFIDQLETVEQEMVLSEKKASLLEAMQNVKEDEQVELLFVAITDILQVNTKLLILSEAEKQVAESAFGGTVIDNVLDIGPKMSRKKEIAPAIEKALKT